MRVSNSPILRAFVGGCPVDLFIERGSSVPSRSEKSIRGDIRKIREYSLLRSSIARTYVTSIPDANRSEETGQRRVVARRSPSAARSAPVASAHLGRVPTLSLPQSAVWEGCVVVASRRSLSLSLSLSPLSLSLFLTSTERSHELDPSSGFVRLRVYQCSSEIALVGNALLRGTASCFARYFTSLSRARVRSQQDPRSR